VGFGVGFAVGSAVGRGVLSGAGVVVGGFGTLVTGWGVGVGPSATMGPPVGAAEAVGSAEGVTDGSSDGCGPGSDAAGVVAGLGLVPGEPSGWDAVATGGGVSEARATSVCGRLGATAPAVSATVARMRFSTPMATTRRAR
jgi:hypothetical protein